MKLLFYDFEVFKYDWLVVIIDLFANKVMRVHNDERTLSDYFESHCNDIWIGYNNKHYDQYIMKSILCSLDPKECNDFIIKQGRAGWDFCKYFNEIRMLNFDIMQKDDPSLKTFEGYLGHNIKESSVPFDIDRKLTPEEIEQSFQYCQYDVEESIECFLNRKNEFDAILGLIKMFPESLNGSDIGLTKAQISAKVLGCSHRYRTDEFDLSVLPCIDINRYTEAIDFFMQFKAASSRKASQIYSKKHKLMIAGLEHTIGWGGIHAGKEKYHNAGKGRQIWHIDVASFYPRLMIFHNLLTRSAKNPEKFKRIYERRLELKHAGKKKEQAPLKIVINGTFGISKSITSSAYDPRNANLICINGQLMLIDLIEHLEVIPDFELIQSNTDGLIVSLPDTDEAFAMMDDICFEWERRCNMELEFDEISHIYQKDVNNYVFEFTNGKLERKGGYVKELSPLDNDLPIVNKAVVDCLTKGIPVEQTINTCNDLMQFQMVRKISSKYSHILYGGYWTTEKRINPETGRMKGFKVLVGDRNRLNERCIRIFASLNQNDGGVWKVKNDGSVAKIEGSPEHCFIFNDEVIGVECPKTLNKQWYISTAKDRLKGFGL